MTALQTQKRKEAQAKIGTVVKYKEQNKLWEGKVVAAEIYYYHALHKGDNDFTIEYTISGGYGDKVWVLEENIIW